jgi:hypothetical protein
MAHKIDRFPEHDEHEGSPQYEIDESPTLVVFGFVHERVVRRALSYRPAIRCARAPRRRRSGSFMHARRCRNRSQKRLPERVSPQPASSAGFRLRAEAEPGSSSPRRTVETGELPKHAHHLVFAIWTPTAVKDVRRKKPVYGLSMNIPQWLRVFRVTRALFDALESIFKPFGAARLDERVRSDEFVVAYLYGVMARFFDVYGMVGQPPSAQILWKCYERVFPGHGKEIVELTVIRIQSKDEKFMSDLRLGSREAREYLASNGKSGFPSLTAHLSTHRTTSTREA